MKDWRKPEDDKGSPYEKGLIDGMLLTLYYTDAKGKDKLFNEMMEEAYHGQGELPKRIRRRLEKDLNIKPASSFSSEP